MFKELKIRNAAATDLDLVYSWSNDELVRKQSFSSEKISYNSHCDWFMSKLNSDSSSIFIVEEGPNPVGIVRFERGQTDASIGVSIDKKYWVENFLFFFGIISLTILSFVINFILSTYCCTVPSVDFKETLIKYFSISIK